MATRNRRRQDATPQHDRGYKRLFSHPLAVEELLRGFLPEGWTGRLDFSTLERVGNSFVADDLRERHGDLIWRLRFRGEGESWFYLYLLLEFQSTSDPFMAVRLLTYVSLLLEEIIRREKLKRRQPDRRPVPTRSLEDLGGLPSAHPQARRSPLKGKGPGVPPHPQRLAYFAGPQDISRRSNFRDDGPLGGSDAGRDRAGMRKLLLQQLTLRFGRLPRNVRERVEAISSMRELQELARRVVLAKTLQDLGLG